MPQPAFDVTKYLSSPLPSIREQYPPGTGGTGPRASWEGSLKSVEVIDNLNERVNSCAFTRLQRMWGKADILVVDFSSDSIPKETIQPHPKHKYPNLVQVNSKLPPVIKSPTDLQTSMAPSLYIGEYRRN